MKIVLITGSDPRHAHYARCVSREFNLVGVVMEKKRKQVVVEQRVMCIDGRSVELMESAAHPYKLYEVCLRNRTMGQASRPYSKLHGNSNR